VPVKVMGEGFGANIRRIDRVIVSAIPSAPLTW